MTYKYQYEEIEIPCPNWIIALLKDIKERLNKAFLSQYNLEVPSPFENTSCVHQGRCFTVYSHQMSSEMKPLYNFKYKNIEITWDKCLGNNTIINGEYSNEEIINMYNDIINEIEYNFI